MHILITNLYFVVHRSSPYKNLPFVGKLKQFRNNYIIYSTHYILILSSISNYVILYSCYRHINLWCIVYTKLNNNDMTQVKINVAEMKNEKKRFTVYWFKLLYLGSNLIMVRNIWDIYLSFVRLIFSFQWNILI